MCHFYSCYWSYLQPVLGTYPEKTLGQTVFRGHPWTIPRFRMHFGVRSACSGSSHYGRIWDYTRKTVTSVMTLGSIEIGKACMRPRLILKLKWGEHFSRFICKECTVRIVSRLTGKNVQQKMYASKTGLSSKPHTTLRGRKSLSLVHECGCRPGSATPRGFAPTPVDHWSPQTQRRAVGQLGA